MSNVTRDGGGLRLNQNKTRLDLMPSYALEHVGQVFTKGAEKYSADNWRSGMSWSKPLASMERHLAAYKQCKDFDEETGLLHMAHLVANGLFLVEYYKIFPQGDDRDHSWQHKQRISIDVDDVIADFCGGVVERTGIHQPSSWTWSYHFQRIVSEISDDENFFLSLRPKILQQDLPFEPVCYITHRNISKEITEKWIESNGFHCSPVLNVKNVEEKVQVAKDFNVEVFVDDRYETFVAMNRADIVCYLMDAPHNRRYDVGYKRVFDLKGL